MLVAATVVVLGGSAGALAQSVPVTVEVVGSERPTQPAGDDPSPTGTVSPAPATDEDPPPAAADPPDAPLARTGADVLRAVRDAAALIGAGLLLLIATRTPGRTAR